MITLARGYAGHKNRRHFFPLDFEEKIVSSQNGFLL